LSINIKKPKIIVIVGPTASGKTALSIELAKRFDGEVISADSRQVYRGLDIGSGKVTRDEMRGVPHHLLDVADPKTVYTVADFVRDGRKAVEDITARGKVPVVVGGTFFYTDALLGKVSMPEIAPNEKLREELEKKNVEELFALLSEKDLARARTIDKDNPRRLVRALEIVDAVGVVPDNIREELYEILTLGISIPKEELHKNIRERLTKRMGAGMLEEVEGLVRGGVSYERLESFGLEYRYVAEYLQHKITEEEMLSLIETKSRQFAKRQMTWLKRDGSIVWVSPEEIEKMEELVRGFVSGVSK
jgi:tRNA dimethylallyltransferase